MLRRKETRYSGQLENAPVSVDTMFPYMEIRCHTETFHDHALTEMFSKNGLWMTCIMF